MFSAIGAKVILKRLLSNGKRISWAIFACIFSRFWSLSEGFCPPITGEPKGVIASYVTEQRFQKRQKDMRNSYALLTLIISQIIFTIT